MELGTGAQDCRPGAGKDSERMNKKPSLVGISALATVMASRAAALDGVWTIIDLPWSQSVADKGAVGLSTTD